MVGGGQSEAELEPVEVSTGGDPAGRQCEAGVEAGHMLRLWEAAEILDLSMEGLRQCLVVDVGEQCQAGSLIVGSNWGWGSRRGLRGDKGCLAPGEL